MADRYNTSGNPEAHFESGAGSQVLRNKLGIQSAVEMDDVELGLFVQLYDIIPNIVQEDQRIGVTNIREWHRRWLGNVYVYSSHMKI